MRTARAERRRLKILELRAQKRSLTEIARKAGVSRRHVARILAEAGDAWLARLFAS